MRWGVSLGNSLVQKGLFVKLYCFLEQSGHSRCSVGVGWTLCFATVTSNSDCSACSHIQLGNTVSFSASHSSVLKITTASLWREERIPAFIWREEESHEVRTDHQVVLIKWCWFYWMELTPKSFFCYILSSLYNCRSSKSHLLIHWSPCWKPLVKHFYISLCHRPVTIQYRSLTSYCYCHCSNKSIFPQ